MPLCIRRPCYGNLDFRRSIKDAYTQSTSQVQHCENWVAIGLYIGTIPTKSACRHNFWGFPLSLRWSSVSERVIVHETSHHACISAQARLAQIHAGTSRTPWRIRLRSAIWTSFVNSLLHLHGSMASSASYCLQLLLIIHVSCCCLDSLHQHVLRADEWECDQVSSLVHGATGKFRMKHSSRSRFRSRCNFLNFMHVEKSRRMRMRSSQFSCAWRPRQVPNETFQPI